MTTGTVRKLVADRGFAFVRSDESGTDHFLHVSDLQVAWEDLQESDRVTFESVQSPKGPRATQVRPA